MIKMNAEQFKQYTTQCSQPVLVEFWAPWCVYCRRLTPALEMISEQYSDSLVVGQVNIDEEAQLADAEQIEVIPTLIVYRDGAPVSSVVAPESKAKLEDFLRGAQVI